MTFARQTLLIARARDLFPMFSRGMLRKWVRAKFVVGCKEPKVEIGKRYGKHERDEG